MNMFKKQPTRFVIKTEAKRQISVTIIGIDLGTTNCCFGYMKDGHLKLIENENGNMQTPSVVLFVENNEKIIGSSAFNVAHMYEPDRFIYETKRIIGQYMNTPEVQRDVKRFTYEVQDDFDAPKIVISNDTGDLSLYPEQISGFILEKILEIAKTRLNETVKEAVITVPAYFGGDQRRATKDAASLASIGTVHIITEPIAAALAFQHTDKKSYARNILIYDFGGGTFDVSIVQAQDYHCKVLAIDGDCHLGGTDIDMNLVEFIRRDIFDKHKLFIEKTDKKQMRRLKNHAEVAKRCLSDVNKYVIDIIFPEIDYTVVITRQQFEEINRETFKRTLKIVDKCISDSVLDKNKIDEVVLVGGSTRIPKIRGMLKEYFGSAKINISSNPDEMVAFGAAVYAESLYGNKKEVFTISDVLSLSLGTDVIENQMSVIIKRNTPVPCKGSKKYVTVYDNQMEMSIKIYQGERLLASQNNLMGDLSITNLTPAPKGKVIVEVELNIDAEGLLLITAKELNAINVRILNINLKKHGLQKNEIEQILKDAEDQKQADLKFINFLKKKKEFDKLFHDLTKEAENFKDERKDDILRKFDAILQTFNNLNINNIDEIDILRAKLLDIISRKETK